MTIAAQAIVVVVFVLSGTNAYSQTDTSRHAPSSFDEQLLFGINHWGDSAAWLDPPMARLSWSASYAAIAVPIGMYTYGGLAPHQPESYAGASLILAEAASGLLTEGIKQIVQRRRPYHVIDGVRQPDTIVGGYSFPSGHATATWALAAGLSLHYQKWYVIAPSVLYATAVSLSRPYLSVHYPSDIFVGALIGSLTSYLFYRLEDHLFARSRFVTH